MLKLRLGPLIGGCDEIALLLKKSERGLSELPYQGQSKAVHDYCAGDKFSMVPHKGRTAISVDHAVCELPYRSYPYMSGHNFKKKVHHLKNIIIFNGRS